ncbi:hypothetical protein BU16DRAFT_585745 [Lophium mytilinum]|uniref:Extracellular membrane protein CFEM domain-containing protein n=1 Tax=Lophium mytilinum TaxID=390894 RepID=A0A6A6QE42_9PEZI|nr:hypothetical protein BU16DRAFT_585745 [Lophium mytilinum]
MRTSLANGFLAGIVLFMLGFDCALANKALDAPTDTITSFPCDTTELPFLRYDSCTSSLSSRVQGCAFTDAKCACNAASSGFSCLTDWCPSYTSAICPASFFISAGCSLAGEPGPSFTHYSCPTTFSDDVSSEFASLFDYISTAFETGASSTSKALSGGKAKETGGSTATTPIATSTSFTITAPSNTAKPGNANSVLSDNRLFQKVMPMLVATLREIMEDVDIS